MSPALFLDRDGVVNEEKNYVHRISEFDFVDGIFKLCRSALVKGYIIVVITNQAGIGRGYYSEEDFQHLTNWMLEQFSLAGVQITRVYYCPYHPTHGLGKFKRESVYRKPNPGMIVEAQSDFDIDLKSSILIGDKASDMEAGQRAGIETLLLFDRSGSELTGEGEIRIERLADAERYL